MLDAQEQGETFVGIWKSPDVYASRELAELSGIQNILIIMSWPQVGWIANFTINLESLQM